MNCNTTGGLVASIAREAGLSGGKPVEGVLFGVRTSDEATSTTDEGVRTSVSSSTAALRHVVTGSRQSFYDSRGEIDGDRLAAIASTHGMGDMRAIGWFVGQKNRGTLRPSVRDAAVHRRLSQALAAGGAAEPCMLLLLNLEVDERASTQSVDYVCLSQLDPPSLRLSPVQSAVLNLTHDSLHEYGQLRALGNAHANAASLPASDVPPAHIVAFERSFDKTMRGLDAQLRDVEKVELEISQLMREAAILEAAVAPAGVALSV